MIELSYQTSLAIKIVVLLPEYNLSEPLAEMLRQITEGQARYLYSLAVNKKRDELKQFIVAHI